MVATDTVQKLSRNQDGFSLMELVAALTLLSTVILSVGVTLVHGFQQRRDSLKIYRATSALRDLVAEIQNCANAPLDLSQQLGVGAVYSRYDNYSVSVPDLPSGEITVTVFADENTVPSVLGGPQDLNGDGDAEDDHGNASIGTDLRLIPLALTLSFSEPGFDYTITIHRLIGITNLM